jgi:hypothetical protein
MSICANASGGNQNVGHQNVGHRNSESMVRGARRKQFAAFKRRKSACGRAAWRGSAPALHTLVPIGVLGLRIRSHLET